MYCPECGTKIDEPVNFCPECGANLIGLFAETKADKAADKPAVEPNEPVAQAEPDADLPEPVMRGFLLTNLTTLSKHLNTSIESLRKIFEQFIAMKRQIGVAYQLVDAGDYEYREKGLFAGHKHIKLGSSSPWYEYADILLDLHKAEVKAKQQETDYLFIVGGNEIVPMPKLPHWGKDDPRNHDKDYDTDFLYAYPYGQEMEEKMWTGKIFTYDALFYTGRLPLVSGDDGLQDLINYFNRDLENSLGIPMKIMYSQSDPNWKGVTAKIISPLISKLKVPDYGNAIPNDGDGFGFMILSPAITIETQDPRYSSFSWFNKHAQYVFINMHGSDAPKNPYYGGFTLGSNSDFYWGMAPDMFAHMEYPNVVFAQPCYGARFIGYPKDKSMVLTALSHKTLIFVGSSRVALGNPKGNCTLEQVRSVPLGWSDITGFFFNQLMMQGYSAGEAFFQARCETYRKGNKSWEDALTIGEFNLYGDPTLFCDVENTNKSAAKLSKAALTTEKEGIFITDIETVAQKSADKPLSMLEQLRQQVNKNIMDISNAIGQHLYEQYGIPKREPFFVQKVKYSNGKENLNFHYDCSENENVRTEFIVQTSHNGEILRVAQTK